MKLKTVFFSLMIFGASVLSAQKFATPANGFSHKKTAYITLEDGTELEGTIKDLDRKKGLIEEIKLQLESGKKIKIAPEEIKHAYLPPSGLDNLARMDNFFTDATQWGSKDINQDIINKGHAYFEKTDVKIKKKTRTLLLQLMNPGFSNHIKVFYDPFAKETMSVGVAGVTLAGGLDKSYYLKLGDDVAYLAKKKDYKEQFTTIFKGCNAVLNDEEGGNWNKFESHVWKFHDNCSE